jgi:hypothetical protein
MEVLTPDERVIVKKVRAYMETKVQRSSAVYRQLASSCSKSFFARFRFLGSGSR